MKAVSTANGAPIALCPRCGGTVNYQVVAENKRRGILSILFWGIMWLCFFWILWIPLLIGRKSKVRTWAVCQSCGYRYRAR